MAHAARELALGSLKRPLRLEVFFVRVDQLRDANDPRGPVSVGPVEPLYVLRGDQSCVRRQFLTLQTLGMLSWINFNV